MSDYSRDYSISYGTDAVADSCTIRFRCFDTPNAVTVFPVDLDDAYVERLLLDVRRACLELHRLWSFTMPASDIARVNGPDGRIKVDSRTARLISVMKEFNAHEPCFDFTVGPISFLWKRARSVPDGDVVQSALSHVGADKIRVEGDEIVKSDPLAQVDVGGAAKGYAADMVAQMVRMAGIRCADIDLGGNLFMVGAHPSGRPWRIAVRVPEGMQVERPILQVQDRSVVTSGSYERFVEIGGIRYQHILDARTGWPCCSDIVSATVVSKSSLEADLLATTTCLLGSHGFDDLKARHPSCEFVALTADGDVLR